MGTKTLLEAAVVLLNETKRLAASILASCSLLGNNGLTEPPFKLRCLEQYPRLWDSLEQPSLEHNLRHCLPLNFLRIPLGVETTSPFLYFNGVAGNDLGEVGVDLGRMMLLGCVGSTLEFEVRDAEVSDLFGRLPCAKSAPGVKEMDLKAP